MTPARRALALLSRHREASIAAVAVVLVVYFQIGSNGAFLSSQILSVVLRETGRLGLIAAAQVMLMITGEIDLSVSGTFSLAPYLMALMSVGWGVPLWVGASLGVLMGVLVGFLNGIVTVRFRVPSLITTVGTLFLLQGIVVSIYNSQPIVAPVEEPFNALFGESLYQPTDPAFSWHAVTAFTPFLWTVAIVGVLALMLNRTSFGLHTIATGSNIVGAREIGVRTGRIKVLNFMIAGACAAFAGIVNTAQFASADPQAGSPTLTLQAIAAAVIGGTSLLGGSGTVVGALIGAFVVATLNNGLIMVGAQATVSDVYLGLAIIAAMILNVQVERLRAWTAPMSGSSVPALDPASPVVLEMSHISKGFGAVTALVDVSIRLRQGEVLALVGDNGAGKSTLIKILSGFHQPDSGTITADGKELRFSSPRDARAHGIETVYQDLAMIGDLSVFHNMFLGREYHKRLLGLRLLDNGRMRRLAREYLDTLGISIPNVNATVDLLSGGQRQCIAVARSIYSSPSILVLDEPLAALGVRESAHVLELIQNLRRQRRVSVILIVHNYNQIFEVCDRINFLHSGEIVLDASTAETSEEELIRIVKSGLGRRAMAPPA